jgi:hypothetical protein
MTLNIKIRYKFCRPSKVKEFILKKGPPLRTGSVTPQSYTDYELKEDLTPHTNKALNIK